MNQIKPEDRPKAFLLVLAILAVFAFSAGNILKLLNIGGGAPPAPTPEPPTATPSPIAVAQSTQEVNPTTAAETDQVLLPNLRNNPFREIPKVLPTPEPAAATPAPRSSPSVGVPRLRLGPGEPVRSNPLPLPFERPSAARSEVPPLEPVKPAPAPLVLKGIISGDDALALIQQGDRQLIVRVGQYVGGYKVVGITVDDVQLRRGKSLRTLSVGAPGVVAIRDATPEPRYPLDEPETVAPVRNQPRRRSRPTRVRPAVVVRHVVVYPGERTIPNDPVPAVALGPSGEPVAVDVPLAPQPSVSAPTAPPPAPVSLPAREIDPVVPPPATPEGVEPPKGGDALPPVR